MSGLNPGLKERWLELCLDLSQDPAYMVVGTRKILRNVIWTISGKDWHTGDFDVEKLVGYRSWKTKKAQLSKYYLNEAEFERASKKYAHIRDNLGRYDSVNMILRNGEKFGWTAQDHCMAAMIVSYWPKTKGKPAGSEIDVYYRTTEVAKKFAADLAFFREVIFPRFEPISKIRFVFSTCNMSVAFTPALFLTIDEPVPFLENIRREDHRHWRRICSYLWRYLCVKEDMKFRQHDRIKVKLQNVMARNKQDDLKQYLEDHREDLQKFSRSLRRDPS